MAQTIENPQKTPQVGGRGLLKVWRKELEKKLSINRYLPRQSKGATLAIMVQMDQCQRRRPGVDKETLCNCDHGDIDSTRTWYCQMSPRTEEAPQRLLPTWPQYLGRGVPTCSFNLPHQPNLPPPLIHWNPHLLNP